MNIIVENIEDGIRIEEYIQWFNDLSRRYQNVKKLQIHFVSEENMFNNGIHLCYIQRDEKTNEYNGLIPLLKNMEDVITHTQNQIEEGFNVGATTLYYSDIKKGTAINTLVTKI